MSEKDHMCNPWTAPLDASFSRMWWPEELRCDERFTYEKRDDLIPFAVELALRNRSLVRARPSLIGADIILQAVQPRIFNSAFGAHHCTPNGRYDKYWETSQQILPFHPQNQTATMDQVSVQTPLVCFLEASKLTIFPQTD